MKYRLPVSLDHVVTEGLAVLRDPRLLAWTLFLVFFPFYVLENGLPQPAAWLLVILMPSTIIRWNGKLPNAMWKTVIGLVWFIVYAVIANIVWTMIVGKISISLKDSFILSPFFYVFNGMLFLTSLLLYKRYGLRFLWLTTRVIIVSLALQVLVSFVLPSKMRATAGFNEPNQLGYYALLASCVLLLGQRRTNLSRGLVVLGLMMASYLALLSASKAALASIALLGIVIVIGRLRTMIVAGLAFTVLILTPNPFSDALDRAQERIEKDESLDFFEERGYDRISNHSEYWVLGSGEGAYRRFAETTAIKSHELHSSLGTLFFCYGIVGTVLFMIFMWFVMRGTVFQTWLIVAPAFAYGMTHQGLRFSLMWVMLALVVMTRDLDRLAKVKKRAA
jgi:hypothetical protein